MICGGKDIPTSTLTTKGQITIPKAVREALGLRPGHRVVFRLLEEGGVILEPETVDLRSLRGCLEPERKGVTLDDMERAIRTAGARP
jgi:AbrB family looped-hinge helix DNA binding protein